jgi:hypothetical protein
MNEAKEMTQHMQANSEPLVTIGLPTYNRPAGLKKCLQTIGSQSYKNLEIIISDNCSTDEKVQEVILEFAAKDSRIKHFRQTVNIGLEENILTAIILKPVCSFYSGIPIMFCVPELPGIIQAMISCLMKKCSDLTSQLASKE